MGTNEEFNQAYEKIELWINQCLEDYELEEPINCLIQLGENGDLNSLLVLAKVASFEIDGFNDKTPTYWYQKAAELGSNFATFKYLTSLFGTKEFSELEEQLSALGKKGYIPALTTLGICYSRGIHVDKDRAKAAPYLKVSANSGSYEGAMEYSELLTFGEGVEEDLDEAIRYFEICVDISRLHEKSLENEYQHHTLYSEDTENIDCLEDAEAMLRRLKEEIEGVE